MRQRRQAGQSVVEFAIVLPILLVLTLGTMALGMFVYRQLTLTGATFLAARAAAVGGQEGNNPRQAAVEVLQAYAQDADQPWIASVVDGSKGRLSVMADRSRTVTVTAIETGDRYFEVLSNLQGLLGEHTSKAGQLGGTVAINREYVTGPGPDSAVQADSDREIEYSVDLGPTVNAFVTKSQQIGAPLKSILGAIPGIPDSVVAAVGVLTFDPLQAVPLNPEGKPFQANRSQSAVYASSDLERIPTAPFQPSLRMTNNLHGSVGLVAGAQAALLLPGVPPGVVQLIQAGVWKPGLKAAAHWGELSLQALEASVFAVKP